MNIIAPNEIELSDAQLDAVNGACSGGYERSWDRGYWDRGNERSWHNRGGHGCHNDYDGCYGGGYNHGCRERGRGGLGFINDIDIINIL